MSELSEGGIISLLERGAAAGYPELANPNSGFKVPQGQVAWQFKIPQLTRAEALEVVRLFDELQALIANRAEREAHAAALAADLAAGPDESLIRQEAERREAEFRAYEAKRPQRIERLLEAIAEALNAKVRE